MRTSPLHIRTAFFLALGISLLINILFLIMFLYRKDSFVQHPGTEEMRPAWNLGITLLHVLLNFITAFSLYLLSFFLLKKEYKDGYKWLIIIPVILVSATAISYFCTFLQIKIEGLDRPSHFYFGALLRDYFITITVVLSSQLIYMSQHQQQTALENKMLVVENMRSRFQALKNQMDPHFLFNSLNTLNSLIKLDGEKAQEYVQQLSSVLRYTLQNREVISLEEELKFTNSYCHLMQIRYGDHLRFVFDTDEKYNNYLVIPLCLQVLVENAIKHNVISRKQVLTITISTSDANYIRVSNPVYPKKEPEKGDGIGLSNLSERYQLMWNAGIVVEKQADLFEVRIPLIMNSQKSRM